MPPRVKLLLSSCPGTRIQRGLSTTSSRLAAQTPNTTTTTTPKGQIPPESPKFIEIPKSRQPRSIYRPWVKGVLPVPRKIFRRSDSKDKTSQEYLTAVTPEPKNSRVEQINFVAYSQPNAMDSATWKIRQSAARRRNLRESLVELHQRKKYIDHSKAESRARKQAESLRLATAPEREDERLTNPTVHRALLPLRRGPLPDPHRAARLKRMRANVETMQREKMEQRRAMLHTLYMNARNFIVRPDQLDEVIERVFEDPNLFLNDEGRGENVWHLGYPETSLTLLQMAGRGRRLKASVRVVQVEDLTKKRLDRIGEELTGGKL